MEQFNQSDLTRIRIACSVFKAKCNKTDSNILFLAKLQESLKKLTILTKNTPVIK